MFTPDGQNWGFPLYNWERITELEFKWWIDRLQSAAAYYHIYRVDHIVGFFRIWAINIGEDSSQGFFMPEDENSWIEHGRKIMWTMLEKCHMLPIGEDLGVVPSQVRLCLSMLGICGTRVMRWEKKWQDDQSFTPTSEYPLDSMTTVSTHDCEPLKIWWQTCMAEAQKFAAQNNLEYHEELSPSNHAQILKWSHNSNSIFHINLLQEYLYLFENLSWKNFTDDRVNVPGTFCDDNWTVRFKPTLEEIITHEDLKKAMKEFSSLKS